MMPKKVRDAAEEVRQLVHHHRLVKQSHLFSKDAAASEVPVEFSDVINDFSEEVFLSSDP
jgi:hypothetical protein